MLRLARCTKPSATMGACQRYHRGSEGKVHAVPPACQWMLLSLPRSDLPHDCCTASPSSSTFALVSLPGPPSSLFRLHPPSTIRHLPPPFSYARLPSSSCVSLHFLSLYLFSSSSSLPFASDLLVCLARVFVELILLLLRGSFSLRFLTALLQPLSKSRFSLAFICSVAYKHHLQSPALSFSVPLVCVSFVVVSGMKSNAAQ